MSENTLPAMDSVISSNVDAVGHDGEALYVRFKNGGTYRYRTADASHHQAMIAAESPGRYFRSEISGKHVGEKL